MLRTRPDHRRPRADRPVRHEAFDHVRIGLGEARGDIGGVGFEEEHRPIDRVRERAAEEQFPAFDGRLGQREVRRSQRDPAFEVIGREFVDEQVVHGVRIVVASFQLASSAVRGNPDLSM